MDLTPVPAENLELQRKPLKEEIFDILHKRIIAGKYSPGEWLRQEDIASSLRVSQTPVREALDLLVSAGLAERVPFRGVRVLQLTQQEMVEAYGLRLLLEPAAARGAAERAAPYQIQTLNRILEQMQPLATLNDMSAQRQLNRELHLVIVSAAGNALLNKVYEMTSNAFPDWMLYEAMFHHPEMLESCLQQEYQEHDGMLKAIAAHLPEQATGQALAHILTVGREMETLLGIPGELLREKERQYISLPASGKR
ncbi:MAG: GntR family transcriptional regulator [Chloroflexi bacterium]|nr:MAG: GntR family transcriptional regulator [Chloroflexota bacterium]